MPLNTDEDITIQAITEEVEILEIGEQGPPGPTGAQGPTGPTGSTGAQGPAGTTKHIITATYELRLEFGESIYEPVFRAPFACHVTAAYVSKGSIDSRGHSVVFYKNISTAITSAAIATSDLAWVLAAPLSTPINLSSGDSISCVVEMTDDDASGMNTIIVQIEAEEGSL